MKKFWLITLLFLVFPAYSHEPLFGLGPHTIYQYGVALESEYEYNGFFGSNIWKVSMG
jgi:hypothetical protein